MDKQVDTITQTLTTSTLHNTRGGVVAGWVYRMFELVCRYVYCNMQLFMDCAAGVKGWRAGVRGEMKCEQWG